MSVVVVRDALIVLPEMSAPESQRLSTISSFIPTKQTLIEAVSNFHKIYRLENRLLKRYQPFFSYLMVIDTDKTRHSLPYNSVESVAGTSSNS